MAAPRVFLSSTYYDLKQVRNDIGRFIESLGYQVVRHEKSSIPYSQAQLLEKDCYDEITLCDIVVCVIGNAFGTQSDLNELSITMNELEKALKNRKMAYVYVEKGVFYENRTYRKNKDNPKFIPAAVDNVKIHEYIANLHDRVGMTRPIQAFESADEIIESLRTQFAGLFQGLLARQSEKSEADDLYELHKEVVALREAIGQGKDAHDDFMSRFSGTILFRNQILSSIERFVGLAKSHILACDIWALDEVLFATGYEISDSSVQQDSKNGPSVHAIGKRTYVRTTDYSTKTITVEREAFNDDGSIKSILQKDAIDKLVKFDEQVNSSSVDIPF